jgi:hypothetical protein
MAIKGSKLPGDASHFARGGKIAKDSSGAIQKARLIHMRDGMAGLGGVANPDKSSRWIE